MMSVVVVVVCFIIVFAEKKYHELASEQISQTQLTSNFMLVHSFKLMLLSNTQALLFFHHSTKLLNN